MLAGNLELIVFVEYSIAEVMMLWMSSSDNQSLSSRNVKVAHDLFVNS